MLPVENEAVRGSNKELESIRRFIVAHQGHFALAFVRVNDPSARKQLLHSLEQELSKDSILLTSLDYSSRNIPSLLDELKAHALSKPAALALTGLDHHIVDLDENDPHTWANQLNQVREAFPQFVRCPITIWLTDYATDRLFTDAPDFADWHAATFRFDVQQVIEPHETNLRSSPVFRSQRIELLEKQRTAVGKSEPPNRQRLAQILRELGTLYAVEDNNAQRQAGIGYLQEAAKLFEDLGNKRELAECFLQLGNVYHWLGQLDKAYKYFADMYRLATEIRNENMVGLAALGMGVVQRGIDFPASDRHLNDALHQFRALNYRQGEADALKHLGHNALQQHESDTALRRYQKAQKIYREIRDHTGEGNILKSRGSVHLARGEWKRAQRILEEALEKFQQLNDKLGLANVLFDLGQLKSAQGQWQQSAELLSKTVSLYHEIGLAHGEGTSLLLLGMALIELSRSQEAIPVFRQAKSILTEIGEAKLAADADQYLTALLTPLPSSEPHPDSQTSTPSQPPHPQPKTE